MDDIEQLYDEAEENKLITATAKAVRDFIKKAWPQFNPVLEVKLKDLFPEPRIGGLKSIWKHGSADVVVYHGDKIIAVFEPGGSHHFTDPKQIRRDKCKWKLCETNGVRCFKFANSVVTALSKRKLRVMYGRILFGMQDKK